MTSIRSRIAQQTHSVLRWLRCYPQHSVPIALLVLYLGVWLMVPRQKSKPVPAPPAPVVIAMPAASPAETLQAEEAAPKDELRERQIIHAGHDLWRIEIWNDKQHGEFSDCARFYRNGSLVHQLYAYTMEGNFLFFGKTLFTTRYPLIALFAHPGAGRFSEKRLYMIRRGELINMVTLGAENGGPVFQDYDGDGKPEWVFDDFSQYVYCDVGPEYFLVYKQLKNGKLKLWKRLHNRTRRFLPERIHRPD